MKSIIKLVLISILVVTYYVSISQSVLKPGFNSVEYLEVLSVNSRHFDTLLGKYTLPEPLSKMQYRSQEVGMDNRWDYWKSNNGVGIISIRGTLPTTKSWLENFYAAMLPSSGEFKNTDSTVFKYKLAENTKAYVHAGWLFGLSFMAEDINKLMHDEYNKGVRDFIIVGHSQGGVMSMLLRSYLNYVDDAFGTDVNIKVYASAAPKPGNLFYAYDFETITQGGWAYRVVNSADWVPQMPLTVQKFDDLNSLSPTYNYKELMDEAPFGAKLYLNHTIKKLDRRQAKLQKHYTKLLNDKAFKVVEQVMPGIVSPVTMTSFDYTVCGNAIILNPTEKYKANFVDIFGKIPAEKVFTHHHFYAYWYLVLEQYPQKA